MTTGRVNQVARFCFEPPRKRLSYFFLTVINFFVLLSSLLKSSPSLRQGEVFCGVPLTLKETTECRPGKLVLRGQTWWFFLVKKKKHTTWSPSKVLTYSDINVKSIQVLFNLRCLLQKKRRQLNFPPC